MIPDTWDFKEVRPYAICDTFAIGKSEEMKKYANIFHHIYKCAVQTGIFHVESLTGYYINNIAKLDRTTVSPLSHWFWFEYPPGAAKTTIVRSHYGI